MACGDNARSDVVRWRSMGRVDVRPPPYRICDREERVLRDGHKIRIPQEHIPIGESALHFLQDHLRIASLTHHVTTHMRCKRLIADHGSMCCYQGTTVQGTPNSLYLQQYLA